MWGCLRQPWRGDGEVKGVKQQSLELRANYCNCNLDSKHRDAAVTGTTEAAVTTYMHTTDKVCVCPHLCMLC